MKLNEYNAKYGIAPKPKPKPSTLTKAANNHMVIYGCGLLLGFLMGYTFRWHII